MSTTGSRSLEQTFKENLGSHWYFVRPGGNWGDCLIYEGAERLADRLGLKWELVSYQELANLKLTTSDCIYLHGGGAFNSWCSEKPFIALTNAVGQPAKVVIQGPVTFEDDSEGLSKRIMPILSNITCQRLVFFLRESCSYRLAKNIIEQNEKVAIAQDHDTAFHLTKADLLDLAQLPTMPKGRYELTVDRQDVEAPSQIGSKMGVSRVYMDPAIEASSFAQWVKIHLYASAINTNRLHSAVVGAIAGKAVVVGPCSYHKNRSMWEYSLADKGVVWSETGFDETPSINEWVPLAIRKSYKFRKFYRAVSRVPVTVSLGARKVELNS